MGVALGLGGLLLFSSRSLFHSKQKDILYFNSSLKGLNPGAPVKFRGVRIGSVAEIRIRHNQASNDFSMPVLIAIDRKLAQSISDEMLDIGSTARLAPNRILAKPDLLMRLTPLYLFEVARLPDLPLTYASYKPNIGVE